MMTPRQVVVLGQVALAAYAVLLGAGGAIGYAKKGSRPSLIAGLASAAVALAALGLTWMGGLGFWLGLFLAAAMLLLFGARLATTRKLMPSGMLAIVSGVVLGLMIWALANLG